ncbi:hypothetical protein [Oceanivirga salmonicida]|uniref:hypothetical protein n=1 Tax=Oceanivirga salmonicida TaxID=1769291 RepID=UPI0008374F44|nr:hypothetical protein [Oceanivirga salmonicida]
MTVRKNITLSENEYEIISDFASANGYTFSEFLRKVSLNFIKKHEEMTLLEFLNSNCKYVSKEEQIEFDNLDIDFNDLNGEELSLEDVL